MSPILTLSPRRNRVLLWLAAALFVGGMIWAAREVLLPYLLGLILAYLLLPVVNGLDRRMPARLRGWHVARPLAIVLTYLLLLILVAGILAFFVPLMAGQISALIDRWPELASRVEDWGTRGWGWYQNHIPADWRQTIEANLTGLINDLIKALQNGLVATARRLFSTISFVIGLVVIPFWLFYILQDESQVKEGVIRVLPLQLRADLVCMARLIDDVLSAYLRGQLLLCLFVGGMATLALLIIGVPFALVLGVVAGILEALPFVGPILGAIPAVLVALLSNPMSALWVAVAFLAIQQVENLLLVPRIAGKSVKLHPAMVMVVLVVGNELAGLVGMLLAVPITAVLRDLFKYLYLRFLDEPLTPEAAMASIRAGKEVQLGV